MTRFFHQWMFFSPDVKGIFKDDHGRLHWAQIVKDGLREKTCDLVFTYISTTTESRS